MIQQEEKVSVEKKKVTISLDEKTIKKLKMLAESSNVSQWIADKVKEATQPSENELNGAIAFAAAMVKSGRPFNSYEEQAIRRIIYALYENKAAPTIGDFYEAFIADNTPEASSVAALIEYECAVNKEAALKPLIRISHKLTKPLS